MLGLMQNKQKKYSGKKPGLGILIIVTVMVLGYVFDSGTDFSMLLPLIVIAAAFVIVFLFTRMLMKTQSSVNKTGTAASANARSAASANAYAKKTAGKKSGTAASGRYTGTEEAIHCAHSRGKQKYLEQIESFLANGIIDKEEYRLLKERYEKLDLPDDFH